jgi:cytochrome c oxidase subunit 2
LISLKSAVILAVIFLMCSAPSGRTESPRRIEITAKRFTYSPDTITLKKGEPVILVLRSSDVTHGLKISELKVRTSEIKKGEATEIQFTPLEAGHYTGKCAHFCGKGHGSMTLQIDVTP